MWCFEPVGGTKSLEFTFRTHKLFNDRGNTGPNLLVLPYLLRQRHLYWNGNNFSKQTAIESHPEHSRVTVGVDQRHLTRTTDDYWESCLNFTCPQLDKSIINCAVFPSPMLTRSPGLSTGSFLVPSLFKRVYASLRLRLHSFPAEDREGIRIRNGKSSVWLMF